MAVVISAKLILSAFRFHSSTNTLRVLSFSTSSPAYTVSIRDKLQDATLSYFDPTGKLRTLTVSELTKDKKAILFVVHGAFTSICSQKHLPGFVDKYGELRAKAVDAIACVSVNDAFMMKVWKEILRIGEEVLLLSDGNSDFTKALGVELDLRDKPMGLGIRSRRYPMLVEDGIVEVLNLEDSGAFTSSVADHMLNAL